MREWREVAGGADGTLGRNDWVNSGVEHVAKRLYHCGTHTAEAFCECIRAEQDHAARFAAAERLSDAAGMRANEIHLKLANLLGGDADAGEFAEAGVNPVGGLS